MMEMKVLVLIAAAALNPLVVRTNEPVGMVPVDCEVSGGAPVTRVAETEQVPDEVAPLPPVRPAAAVKKTNEIQELQRALAKNDRAAFDAALARAREEGAQTRVYEDIAKLWDAQFESPFFAEGSEPHRIAGSYRGYEEAVRRQVFTDARGRKFYPAAESKAFVARQVGVSAPGPSTSTSSTRRTSAEPSRASSTPRKTKATTTTSTTSKSTQSKSGPPVTRRTSSATEASHPIPSARPPRPATTAPAPVVTPAASTSAAAAPPGAGSSPAPSPATTAVTETTAPATETAVAPDTAVSDTTPTPATPDTVSETTSAPTTSAAPAATPAKGRSIILPAIMILIGLGVLILLFRTAK